ncbi:MAG: 30S ribosomal protein S18 [Actinobacteria bacterium]|nr:30S ribosomal protein S18 [Actinomycetota bacterium]
MQRRRRQEAEVKRRDKAPLIPPHVTHIDYKDVELLRNFISDRGKIRSRAVTGLSVHQQRLVAKAVKNAREMALLPYSGRFPSGR